MSSLLTSQDLQLETGGDDPKPLTDQERALLQRLLSDPFQIPMAFKTWLVSFLEGSDLLLPRSSVQGLSSLLGTGGGPGVLGMLPAGMLFLYAGGAVPDGAFFTDGHAVSRTQYARLFTAIGTLWGPGDGSTTFNLPDLQRRIPWCSGPGVGVGATDGLPVGSRTVDHHHTIPPQTTNADGTHFHNVGASGSTDGVGDHQHATGEANQFAAYAGGQANLGSGGTLRNIVAKGITLTGGGGSHGHSVSVSGGTDAQGSHTHQFSGFTSGGAAANHPAFAVVPFLINW